jgi:hypothetical protein
MNIDHVVRNSTYRTGYAVQAMPHKALPNVRASLHLPAEAAGRASCPAATTPTSISTTATADALCKNDEPCLCLTNSLVMLFSTHFAAIHVEHNRSESVAHRPTPSYDS